jgi:hypothetical protein
MTFSPASLPLVVIFERHWDQEPKKLLKALIPELSKEGYDTLCFEASQNSTEEDLLSSHRKGLELDLKINSQAYEYLERAGIKDFTLCDLGFEKLAELMRLYVSSQRYLDVAEKIKGLPASLLLKDILYDAKKRYFSIKGIDANVIKEIISIDLSQRIRVIEEKEDLRISTIFSNLLNLYKSGKNVVFVCGALHAENLINQFNEKGMQSQILYYFPHSDKSYDDSVDDVKEHLSNETLKNHTFCLLDEQDRTILKERIVKEIKSKNLNYKEEIMEENSHSKFLSDFFNVIFKAHMRPGHYLDAVLNTSNLDDCKGIIKKLDEVNVSSNSRLLEGRNHLVVRNVNTKEVAENIRRLT